jgi:molybdenum cofactor cytidylyltransferase
MRTTAPTGCVKLGAMTCTAIVLAAGAGSRMGGPLKQLLILDGKPILQHVLDAVAAAGLTEIVLVLGHEAGRVAAGVTPPPGTTVVVNAHHADGQASSLRAGLDHAPDAARSALVALGDQPGLRPDAVRAVVDAHARSGAPVARAAYRGRASHPVLLDRAVWPGVETLRGDQGARALITAHAGSVELVEVGGDPPGDVDTPEDLERMRARPAGR